VKFRDVPVDTIVIVGYTADGPYYAKKTDAVKTEKAMAHNAMWVTEDGELRGICYIMEDQDVEIPGTDDTADTTAAKPKRGTGKRARGGSPDRRVPVTSSNSGGESVG
jgi:hypothetical protein